MDGSPFEGWMFKKDGLKKGGSRKGDSSRDVDSKGWLKGGYISVDSKG